MDGQTAAQVPQSRTSPSESSVWRPLSFLLLIAVLIHAWILCHTEVTARDSIAYIRYAWRLEHMNWGTVLREGDLHPGYPAAILLMKQLVQPFFHGSTAAMMQLSAQLVSCFFGVLLVVPMYFLGRELFPRAVGFWATFLFQCLPATGHVLSDGLSEAMFLCFAAHAAWMGVRGLRTGARWNFAVCGLAGAGAYLVRPEGALLVGATGMTLCLCQALPGWRMPWLRAMTCAAALWAAAVVVGCPLFLTTGKLVLKPTPNMVLDRMLKAERGAIESDEVDASTGLFASFLTRTGNGAAFRMLVKELVRGFDYFGWIPLLLGLWWQRRCIREQPGHWLILLIVLGVGFLLWRVAALVGYVSDRHAMLILFFGVFWMAAGLIELPARLAWLAQRMGANRVAAWCRADFAVTVAVLALVLPSLPSTLERLHYNRRGFRDAGAWLAAHSTAQDPVVDPYCWSHYYAGRVFIEGQPAPAERVQPDHAPSIYVVLEEAGNPHDHLTELRDAEKFAKKGNEVYRWKGRRGKQHAEVAIYEVPSEAQ